MIEELVAKYQETKDSKYFTPIYEKSSKSVYLFIRKRFHAQLTEEDINDIISETFVIIINKIDQYNPSIAKFNTWIFKIAFNVALTKVKLNNRRSNRENSYYMFNDTTLEEEGGYKELSFNSERLIKLIMDADCKDIDKVIFKEYLAGNSYESISIKYNINLNTVKSKIRKIRVNFLWSTEEYSEYLNFKYS